MVTIGGIEYIVLEQMDGKTACITKNFAFTAKFGDDNNFGPNLTIVTPLHPLVAEERKLMLDPAGKPGRFCYAKGVKIGNDCWFGANVVVCPGVTIGDRCVIGAGSVVTRDIPSDSLAAGVPCRVLRPITENDSMSNLPQHLGGCAPLPK